MNVKMTRTASQDAAWNEDSPKSFAKRFVTLVKNYYLFQQGKYALIIRSGSLC